MNDNRAVIVFHVPLTLLLFEKSISLHICILISQEKRISRDREFTRSGHEISIRYSNCVTAGVCTRTTVRPKSKNITVPSHVITRPIVKRVYCILYIYYVGGWRNCKTYIGKCSVLHSDVFYGWDDRACNVITHYHNCTLFWTQVFLRQFFITIWRYQQRVLF